MKALTQRAKGLILNLPISGTGTSVDLVAAVSGKRIRIMSLLVTSDTDCTIQIADNNGTPNVFVGALPTAARGGFRLEKDDDGHGTTAAGKKIVANISPSSTIGGIIQYLVLSDE